VNKYDLGMDKNMADQRLSGHDNLIVMGALYHHLTEQGMVITRVKVPPNVALIKADDRVESTGDGGPPMVAVVISSVGMMAVALAFLRWLS